MTHMATEIKIPFSSAFTLYFVIRNRANLVWHIVGQVFEAWGTSGRDANDYAIALVDDAGGMHVGDFDTNIAQGHYTIQVYINTGTPADGDDSISGGNVDVFWDGSSELTESEFELLAYDPPTNTEMLAAHSTTDGKVDTAQTDLDTITDTGVNVVSEDNIDFRALKKTSLDAATPSVTVSDKTGFSLSTAGILAIWHQPTATVVTASTVGTLIVDSLDATIGSRAPASEFDQIRTWALGNWQPKDGVPGTYEVLDPDDGVTPVLEVTPDGDSGILQVVIL